MSSNDFNNGGGRGPQLQKKPRQLPIGPPDMPQVNPSEEEFANLEGFLLARAGIGSEHGSLKVVPPDGYKARSTYDDFDTLMRCCATQTAMGENGLYDLSLEDVDSMYMSDMERTFDEWSIESEVQWSSDLRTAEIEFWRHVGMGDSSTVYTAQSFNASAFAKAPSPWNINAIRQQVSLSCSPSPHVQKALCPCCIAHFLGWISPRWHCSLN
jgi:hypothetical protein